MKSSKKNSKNASDIEKYLGEYYDRAYSNGMSLNKKVIAFSVIIAISVIVFSLVAFMPKRTTGNANKLTSSVTAALAQEQTAKNADKTKISSATTYTAPWFSLDGSKIVFHNDAFSGTTLLIPQEFDGTEITEIDGISFSANNNEITDLEIPASVQSVESGAFENFTALKNVVIPKTVKHIAGTAFKNTPWYKNIKDEFYLCGDGILIKYGGDKSDITVPDGVKYLDCAVFSGNKEVTSVTLPDSVVYIGESVFKESGLKTFTPSPNITYVANDAFFDCEYTENSTEDFIVIGKGCMIKYTVSGGTLRIPDNVRQISGLQLNESGKNVTMYIGKNVEKVADVKQLGYVKKFAVFSGNSNFSTVDGALYNKAKTTLYRYPVYKDTEKYVSPEKLKVISPRAFYGCTLKSAEISTKVYSVGEEAFKNCVNLTEIDLPDSVVNLGAGAFEGCKSLTGAYLSENLFSVPRAAFKNCENLKNITFPDSIKYLRAESFENCKELKEVYIGENMRFVALNAFENCNANFSVSEKNVVIKIKNSKPVTQKPQIATSSLYSVTSGDPALKDATAGE